RKPCLFTLSVYSPGATYGKIYCPAELVTASRFSLVAVLVISTFASGTLLPPGSVTLPRTIPVLAVCPFAGSEMVERVRNKAVIETNVKFLFTGRPFSFRKFGEIGRERRAGTLKQRCPTQRERNSGA